MVDVGDLFLVRWAPNLLKDGKYLAVVIEPHFTGTGWTCVILETGLKYKYDVYEIEEGKKLLEQQTSYR